MCSNAINKALEKVPFVESVRSDIKNSAFNIVFRQGSDVDMDKLKEAVEDAGFSVGSLKITGNFNEQQVSADRHFSLGQLNFHYLGTEEKLLSGEQTFTVLDKDFVTVKEFKKLRASTAHSCYEDGKANSCCITEGIKEGARVYHVRI
jgi:copper chaperone CopZ